MSRTACLASGAVPVLAVLAVLGRVAAADPAGSFAATGSLADGPRMRHAAVRLDDGQVLVVGGSGRLATSGGAHDTLERYNPATETWAVVATMAVRRNLESVHRLPDGRVLIVGGDDGPTVHATCEIWDPASPSAVSTTGSMGSARWGHAHATLSDGSVLVVGGMSTNTGVVTPMSSVERYDPTGGTWSGKAPMTHARQNTATVLLADGTVLVTGGDLGHGNGFAGTKTCQRYNPATDTWSSSSTEDLLAPRSGHAAVRLLDGRVLVIGGGKNATGAYIFSTEIFDPSAGTWSAAGTIGAGGDKPTLTLLADGRVLAAGGYAGVWLAAADLFDPATGTWTSLPPMLTPRSSATATLLADGRVLLAGGSHSATYPHWTAACELFSVAVPDLPPTANAGPDLSVHAGDEVTLDGSASSDDNTPLGDLGFAWSFVSKPAGSTASLAGAATATPSFTADVPGTFVLSLVVEDGLGQTHADEVVVSSANLAPTVDAGADIATTVGTAVSFAGSAWDPEDDFVTVAWTIVSAPAGSTATLTGADTLTPSLTPDVAGTYVLGLAASDPWADAEEDYVVVTAALAGPTVEELLSEASGALTALPTSAFDAPGHKVAFAAQLRNALQELARYRAGDADALVRAAHHVRQLLERTDGFPLRGALDKKGAGKDWIVTSAGQFAVYEPLRDALDALVP